MKRYSNFSYLAFCNDLKKIMGNIPLMNSFTIRRAANKVYVLGRKFLKNVIRPIRFFQDTYNLPDNSYVVKYCSKDIEQFFDKSRLRWERTNNNPRHVQVSLISCIRNEVSDIDGWFDRVLNQTLLPDEIIIVDGGSTDGTKEKLEYRSRQCEIPIRVLFNRDRNIAENRNLAIEEARYPIIAVVDFGGFPKKDWLEKITLPFKTDDEIVVSAGTYDPISRKKKDSHDQKKLWYWYGINEVNPQDYLPPGGSIAYRKEAWCSVGGYPEWLTLTGEDTYFDIELKSYGGKWAFAPEAVVEWIAPDTLAGYLEKLYQWAIGDGESGVHARYYWLCAIRLLLTLGMSIAMLVTIGILALIPIKLAIFWIGILLAVYLLGLFLFSLASGLSVLQVFQKALGEIAQVSGFVNGAKRRKQVTSLRFGGLKGAFFILSGIPIDDTGGGARSTQIALELLRQGYMVVYIHKFPKYESKDLNIKFAHPNLIVHSLGGFNWEKIKANHFGPFIGKQNYVLVEFPIPEFLPLIQKIKEENGTVIYDLLDDWQTSLGGNWYSEATEMEIIKTSDILLATAPRLKDRLSSVSQRKVTLIPNAVNDALFKLGIEYPKPKDMPEGDRVIIYVGALWGEWFDWNLLDEIASQNRADAVCMIGDYRGQSVNLPSNIYFLGLKPQKDLPAYLYHSDVAIIPWKVNKITQATSPLKVYEYLAMNLPVVAPFLETLKHIPGVMLARDRDEFIHLVSRANKSLKPSNDNRAFVRKNNWRSRVIDILALVNEQNFDERNNK